MFKQKHPRSWRNARRLEQGFTLIELIVVVAILGIVLGLVTVNIAGQRNARNLNIAQNELISNIRKIQSYTLSARNVFGNQPASYYVMKFDLANPTQYTIQSMYDVTVSPKIRDIETINLPKGITFSGINPIQIKDRKDPNPQNQIGRAHV